MIMSKKEDDLRRLKSYVINRLRIMDKRQREALIRLEDNKSSEDYLSVEELISEFGISRSTFNRYRVQGLAVLQNGFKGHISIKKGDYIQFINSQR